MLFDFHHTQNARKPGSVHATYLLTGSTSPKPIHAEEKEQDREDAYMQSSPFMSSSMPQEESIHEAPPVKVITLAREEDLEGMALMKLEPTVYLLRLAQLRRLDTMTSYQYISTASSLAQFR